MQLSIPWHYAYSWWRKLEMMTIMMDELICAACMILLQWLCSWSRQNVIQRKAAGDFITKLPVCSRVSVGIISDVNKTTNGKT